jgi:hypothetical protein
VRLKSPIDVTTIGVFHVAMIGVFQARTREQ